MLFQLDHIAGEDAGAGADAVGPPMGVDAGQPCEPFLVDRFEQPTACLPWGEPKMVAGATVTSGMGLVIQPAMETASRGACEARIMLPLTERGVMVEVNEVIGGQIEEWTSLVLAPDVDLAITAGRSVLRFTNTIGTISHGDVDEVPYSPATMRWWRMRRLSPTQLIAEYSPDAQVWFRLGVVNDSHIATWLSVAAGYGNNQSTGTGKAVFRQLIVCN
jgi:hypothetical protein